MKELQRLRNHVTSTLKIEPNVPFCNLNMAFKALDTLITYYGTFARI